MTCTLTPLSISVLALLSERPMHPYEMYQLLLERREDRVVKVRLGSLYHTVERLAGDQLVEATGTTREGNRPERTTYDITAAGRGALRERVTDVLVAPVNEFPIFPVALGESHNLDRTEMLESLGHRQQALEDEAGELSALMDTVRLREVPEAYWFQLDYLHTMTTSELDWISRLASRLERKELTWPHEA